MGKLKCRTCGQAFEGDGRRRYCEKHTPKKRVRDRSRPRVLHAIGPDDVPPARPRPTTIAEAAEQGSTIDELRLTRARIARTLDDPNCPPRDLSSLSKRLIEIGREIDALKRQQEDSDGGHVSEDEAWDSEAI